MTENEMVVWHHQLNGHEFEEAQGVDDGQGGLACCCPWGSQTVGLQQLCKIQAFLYTQREVHQKAVYLSEPLIYGVYQFSGAAEKSTTKWVV